MSAEIACPICREFTLLLREPIFEGLKKTGEKLLCSSCGHRFASEHDLVFKGKTSIQVFSDADRSVTPKLFEEGELTTCVHCRHYVVNPFMQWCGRHRREVAATDSCVDFEKPPADSEAPKALL